MSIKITGETPGGGTESVKRFYMDGIRVEAKCPNCGAPVEWVGKGEYMIRPENGEEVGLWLYCDACDTQSLANVRFKCRVTLETIEGKGEAVEA